MSIVLFSYRTTCKVGTGHTPLHLVYELYPLLPIEYMLPSKPNDNRDPQLIRVLISQLYELKKLQKNKLIAQDPVAFNQWNR